jgi:hypothetical protein
MALILLKRRYSNGSKSFSGLRYKAEKPAPNISYDILAAGCILEILRFPSHSHERGSAARDINPFSLIL